MSALTYTDANNASNTKRFSNTVAEQLNKLKVGNRTSHTFSNRSLSTDQAFNTQPHTDDNDIVHELPNRSEYNRSATGNRTSYTHTRIKSTANERLNKLQSSNVTANGIVQRIQSDVISASTNVLYDNNSVPNSRRHSRHSSSVEITNPVARTDTDSSDTTSNTTQINHIRHTSVITERLNKISAGARSSYQSTHTTATTNTRLHTYRSSQDGSNIIDNTTTTHNNTFQRTKSSTLHHQHNTSQHQHSVDIINTTHHPTTISPTINKINVFNFTQTSINQIDPHQRTASVDSIVESSDSVPFRGHSNNERVNRLQRSHTRMAKLKQRKSMIHQHTDSDELNELHSPRSPSIINRALGSTPTSQSKRFQPIKTMIGTTNQTPQSDTHILDHGDTPTLQQRSISDSTSTTLHPSLNRRTAESHVQLRQDRIDEMKRKVNALTDNKATAHKNKAGTRLERIARLEEMKQHLMTQQISG